MTSNSRSVVRGRLAGGLLLVSYGALTGCTTGYTSSFSQAPIFFAEAVDEQGGVLADSGGADERFAYGDFEAGIPSYLTVGGNAVLPVQSVVTPAAIDAMAALPANPLANAGLPGGPAPTGSGVRLASIAVLPPAMAAQATSTVAPPFGQGLASAAGIVAVASPAISAPPAASISAAVPSVTVAAVIPPPIAAPSPATVLPVSPTLDPTVSAAAPAVQALVTRGLVLTGSSAGVVPAIGSSGLLATTAADIVRMCGLRKCGG